MKLYQYEFDLQPHYVVAVSYADAVQAILREYPSCGEPDRVDCLGECVLVSDRCAAEEEPST